MIMAINNGNKDNCYHVDDINENKGNNDNNDNNINDKIIR